MVEYYLLDNLFHLHGLEHNGVFHHILISGVLDKTCIEIVVLLWLLILAGEEVVLLFQLEMRDLKHQMSLKLFQIDKKTNKGSYLLIVTYLP